MIEKEHERLRMKRITSCLPSRATTSMSNGASGLSKSELLEKFPQIQNLQAQLLAKKLSKGIIYYRSFVVNVKFYCDNFNQAHYKKHEI